MKINIIGGSGIVGNGIFSVLSKNNVVEVFGSDSFDKNNLKYKNNKVFNCDVFVHAAGITDELVNDDYDLAVYKSNKFIKYLIENLTKYDCKSIVYISTIHVYGNLDKLVNPNPISIYSLLHYSTEKTFEILLKNYKKKINLLCLRIPTVYGFPYNIDKLNRPNIIQFSFPFSVIENNQITLKTSGNQYRLFSSNFKVGNVIEKWILDLDKNQFTIENVDGKNITVKNFAKLCLKQNNLLNDSKSKLILNNVVNDNNIHKSIKVESFYKCSETYTINQFINDIYQYYNKF
tara:strand:+ start:1566 stop:2435 length:870 start_codon:yes stop_codon:yes gene_type:complete